MTPWKLFDYSPEPGVNPVREWYDEQDDDIQSEFDNAILFFRANEDWTDAYGVRALTGKHLGLYEITVTADLENGDQVQFGAIGKYQSNSCNFVLFLVCNRYDDIDTYLRCLDRALGYAQAWERKDPKGEIYEHLE